MSKVMERNIQALVEMRRRFDNEKSHEQRIADAITGFTGSIGFIYLHVLLLVAWILTNLGFLPLKPFDPYPFVMLAMIASVEAIFLSTLVLISQNRSNELAEQRAELDLQINLLSEHKITQVLAQLERVYGGAPSTATKEDLRAADPEGLLQAIDEAKREIAPG